MIFHSNIEHRGTVYFPPFSGLRIMMMPVILGDMKSIPNTLSNYKETVESLFEYGGHAGKTGYLTIDEKMLEAGKTQRRSGIHVDGVYRGGTGSWGGGGWGGIETGMITASSHTGCRAWKQWINGVPGDEGECGHLAGQLLTDMEIVLSPFEAYWMGGLCVHESLPMVSQTKRQFIRLSLPSVGPWFENYTPNPLGVLPSGLTLPKRILTSRRGGLGL